MAKYSMQIFQSLKELQHITLDLRLSKLNRRIFQESRQIVFHVWRDHVHACFLSPLSLLSVSRYTYNNLSGEISELPLFLSTAISLSRRILG